jgi:hypothetical protein
MKKVQPKIATEWRDYRTKVLPPNCSHIQLQETRRAFYLGVVSALHIMVEIGKDDWSQEEGAVAFDGLIKECERFCSQIGRKY